MQALQIHAECPGIKWVNVDSSNDVTNLFLGGMEGIYALHPCRFYLGRDIIAGKAILTNGFHSCWAPINGKEVERHENFELLTNPGGADLQYKSISSGQPIPSDAVIVGRNPNGNLIHSSRGLINNVQTLGKFDNGNCYLPYRSLESSSKNCEILTCRVPTQIKGTFKKVLTSSDFNKDYVGVAFSAYTKEWEGKTTPPWNSYGIDDVKKALALVSTKFRSITTYSMGVDTWNVDKPWDQANANCLIAKAASQINKERNRLDLKVNIGAYQNDNAKIMQKEITAAFDAAADANSKFKGTVWGITFTNEYILNESQGYRVLNMITQNKAKAKSQGLELGTRTQICSVIMSNSNPLYNVFSQIAMQSDFIMCNMYPEERVVHGPIDSAVDAVGNAYKDYAAAFKKINPNLKVIIGETGWPSQGVSFNKSPNTVANLSKFWHSMATWANKNQVLVHIFEGIDEPWKSNPNNLDPNATGGFNGAEGHYGWWKRQGDNYIEKANGA